MAQIEFQGKDLEEAIALAAEALSLPPEKIKFSVLTMGAKGFLGLGKRKAKIAVDPDDPALSVEEKASEPTAKDKKYPARTDHSARTAREEKAKEKQPEGGATDIAASQVAEGEAQKRNRRDAPSRRNRSEENAQLGGAEEESDSARLRQKKNLASAAAAPGLDRDATEEARPLAWDHVPPPLSRPAPGEKEEPADKVALEAAEVAGEIISRMGFKAEVESRRIGPRIILSLQSDDNAILIGSRGATLEALQLLAGKIISKRLKEAGAESVRVVVDAADYRFRRQETLLENLKSAAEQVRRSHKPQTLSGLSSADRRLIQLALKPFKDLSASHAAANRDCLVIAATGSQPRHRSRRRHHNGPQK